MKRKMVTDPTYEEQQRVLDGIAKKLGVTCFRPDYHGEKGDKNTVLFYTQEDDAYNCELDKGGPVQSEQYRRPFWTFENSDANGLENHDFVNHGKLDLRPVRWRDTLEGAVRISLALRRQNEHFYRTGGMWALREADETYNNLNREQISAFKQANGTAFLGSINFYDDQRKRIVASEESIYEEYNGQQVYTFGCSFVVPVADEKLEALVRKWNEPREVLPGIAEVDVITRYIGTLGGLNFVWY